MFLRPGLDIVTIFHKPSSAASMRVLAALRDASAKATANTLPGRSPFSLDVTELPPTLDQLRCILDYMSKPASPSVVVRGAHGTDDAFKKFKETPATFQRPVVVDWNRGKAIASENESDVLNMLIKPNR